VKGLLGALILLSVLSASGLITLTLWPRHHASDALVGNSGQGAVAEPATLGEFTPLDPPRPAPEARFTERDGTPRRLADFRGRWVLVNLWATWCAPCVREMPSLDRLQAKLGSRLTVLAISEDRGGGPVVDPFLKKLRLEALAIYLDPKAGVEQALAVRGLPTSFLIDEQGRIQGQLEGAAEWDSPKMLATLERYLRPAPGNGVIKTSLTR
jgi:thiol-disulfide isomerase/thioredoxin